ncbi:GntR family transcriptional regulator [Rhodococcoides fascians]|uniref:GntR family transcriptional regulator n=1 Tax=Rhodococcoides fascians TaxID=1828 RepID=UPI0006916945|nr:GntR family transcriptional regulator [Rhodococcus fascians]
MTGSWHSEPILDTGPASRAELAYAKLRRAVVCRELEPGSWVSEAGLQEASTFGRTPTREACGRLVADGLLRLVPRNGYQVAPLSWADMNQLFDVFETLAPLTARLAHDRCDARLSQVLDQACVDTGSWNLDRTYAFTSEIFDGILRAAGNVWLTSMSAVLFNHLQRVWVLSLSETAADVRVEFFRQMRSALTQSEEEAAVRDFVRFTENMREVAQSSVNRFEWAHHSASLP